MNIVVCLFAVVCRLIVVHLVRISWGRSLESHNALGLSARKPNGKTEPKAKGSSISETLKATASMSADNQQHKLYQQHLQVQQTCSSSNV